MCGDGGVIRWRKICGGVVCRALNGGISVGIRVVIIGDI